MIKVAKRERPTPYHEDAEKNRHCHKERLLVLQRENQKRERMLGSVKIKESGMRDHICSLLHTRKSP